MLSKVLKVSGQIAIGLVEIALDVADNKDDHQMSQLSDGLGNYVADGEHYTEEEIKVIKSRGELYDTYL